jgi:hypothetical protein
MSSQPWYSWYSEAELTANESDPEMPGLVSMDEEYNDLNSDDESSLPRELLWKSWSECYNMDESGIIMGKHLTLHISGAKRCHEDDDGKEALDDEKAALPVDSKSDEHVSKKARLSNSMN